MADNFFKISKGVNLSPQSGTPSNPLAGDQYYDSVRNTLSEYINGNWTDIQSRSDVASASSMTSSLFTSSVVRSSIVKITGSTSGSLHGMASGSDAKYFVLYNASSVLQTLKHASGTETTAANRIVTSTGADTILPAGQSALFFYDSAQSRWVLVSVSASASGGGAKNYLGNVNNSDGNGNFEAGSLSGWSLFNTTMTGVLPTGSISAGAASVTTFDIINTAQLAGTYSLRTASSSAWSAGQGFISDARTIDKEDRAKILTFKAYYECFANPSNGNFSGTSSNTFAVYFYDVANSEWVQPAGVYGITQNSGVGYVTGTFQTSSNASSYRMAIIAVNASSGAITMYWDDFSLSPQTAPIGAAISDWTAYTPVLTASTSNPTLGSGSSTQGQWRRVGDSIEVQAEINFGSSGAAAGSGTYRVSLPTGVVCDTSKFTLSPARPLVGIADLYVANTGRTTAEVQLDTANATFVVMYTSNTAVTNSSPGVWTNNDSIKVNFTVPVVGWSSNVQMSNDSDTRVVTASYFRSGAGSVTGANPVNFTTKVFDTHGAVTTGASWKYTAPVSGFYRIAVSGLSNSTTGNFLDLYKNGAGYAHIFSWVAGVYHSGAITVQLNAGEFVDVRPTATLTLTDGLISVERVSGPSVIAATESVFVVYTDTAGSVMSRSTSGGNDTPWTTIPFPTRIKDSHGAFSGGVFTAPISGLYKVDTNACVENTAGNSRVQLRGLYNNSTIVMRGAGNDGSGADATSDPRASTNMSGMYYLNAGDTLQVQLYFDDNTANRNLVTAAGFNMLSIVRVAN